VQSESNQTRGLKRYNENRVERDFQVGDKVLLLSMNLSNAGKGITGSMMKKYKGPFVISKVISKAIYQISCPHTEKIVGKVHVSQVKPFYA